MHERRLPVAPGLNDRTPNLPEMQADIFDRLSPTFGREVLWARHLNEFLALYAVEVFRRLGSPPGTLIAALSKPAVVVIFRQW